MRSHASTGIWIFTKEIMTRHFFFKVIVPVYKHLVSSVFWHFRGIRGKESTCSAGDLALIPGWEEPLEKGMAPYPKSLAWRIPWTEEPGRLQSMGSQRVGHDLHFLNILAVFWIVYSVSHCGFNMHFSWLLMKLSTVSYVCWQFGFPVSSSTCPNSLSIFLFGCFSFLDFQFHFMYYGSKFLSKFYSFFRW